MVDRETELSLEEDLVDATQYAESAGAHLEPDENGQGVYWLAMSPRDAPDEKFFARIAWSKYPHSPPSVRFADGVGGRLDATSAWPAIPGYRPGNLDICQPFTAEGFVTHPEWVNGPEAWPTTGNPFLWVVSTLLYDLAERYMGRSA